MSLKEKLDKIAEASAKQIPEAAQKIMHDATAALADSVAGRSIPKVGEPLPEFELPNSNGTMVSSKDLAAKSPFIISFFRGQW